jgi:hypothetical protein
MTNFSLWSKSIQASAFDTSRASTLFVQLSFFRVEYPLVSVIVKQQGAIQKVRIQIVVNTQIVTAIVAKTHLFATKPSGIFSLVWLDNHRFGQFGFGSVWVSWRIGPNRGRVHAEFRLGLTTSFLLDRWIWLNRGRIHDGLWLGWAASASLYWLI